MQRRPDQPSLCKVTLVLFCDEVPLNRRRVERFSTCSLLAQLAGRLIAPCGYILFDVRARLSLCARHSVCLSALVLLCYAKFSDCHFGCSFIRFWRLCEKTQTTVLHYHSQISVSFVICWLWWTFPPYLDSWQEDWESVVALTQPKYQQEIKF